MHRKISHAGFTLVELLIVLGILFVVIGGVVTLFVDTFSFNRSVSNNLGVNGEARRTLKVMMQEVRTMSPSSLGAYPLVQAGTSSLIFYSDIGSTTVKERVRYFLQNGALKKGVVQATGTPLVYNLGAESIVELVHVLKNSSTSPIFSYYDDTYAGTTTALVSPFDISTVRLIKVDLHIGLATTSSSTSGIYSTQISLRNLKDNL
jgi:type II secretory pathway pseudopilin PulG